MRGGISASVVAVVLALSGCTFNQQQAANSPDATPSTPAVTTTPSTAPTPTDAPTPSTAPPAAPSPSPAKLIITSVNFHMGEVGVAYGTVTAGAAGGVKPYKWSIGSGALPPGLALSKAGGSTTGKPTAPGTFSFVIRVDDSAGGAAGVPRSIYVFRQLAFNVTSAMCGNVPKKFNNCSTALHPPLHIPYSGGTSGAKPTVKITGITGVIGKPSFLRAGCFTAATNSPPPGMTVSASGGFMTLSAGPPDGFNWCSYSATITFVLVNPSPCGAGFLCTSSNTLSVVFSL
jgi:hypothetical protein